MEHSPHLSTMHGTQHAPLHHGLQLGLVGADQLVAFLAAKVCMERGHGAHACISSHLLRSTNIERIGDNVNNLQNER